MKVIAVFCLVVITILMVLTYFDIYPDPGSSSLGLFVGVWVALLAIVHLGLGYYIGIHARAMDSLFLDIPPWVWGMMGVSMGVPGVAIYWLANCSRFVGECTVAGYEDEPRDE